MKKKTEMTKKKFRNFMQNFIISWNFSVEYQEKLIKLWLNYGGKIHRNFKQDVFKF